MPAPPDPTQQTAAPAPLRDLPVVVVGAGPVGTLCASMLSQRGVRAVVVDRLDNPGQGLNARSYVISLTGRAETVMDTCDGLMARVKAAAVESRSLRLDAPRPGRKPAVLDIRLPDKQPPFQFLMRTQIMSVLYDYAREQNATPVEWRTGCKVAGIAFGADGAATLRLVHADGTAEELVSSLVLGCDGKHSPTLAALRADVSGNVESTAGFAERSWPNFTSHKAIKSVVMDGARPVVRDLLPKEHDWPDDAGYSLFGEAADPKRQFALSILPTSPAAGGLPQGSDLASALIEKDSDASTVSNVADAFKLFEENFPTLDVRAHITEESMRNFVDHGPGIPFGDVRRPASVAGAIGKHGGGGVVMMGDAAHSFPPDLGLGLNTGIEDVGVLMGIIDALGAKATGGDVARAYEKARDDDVEGLVFLHRFGAKWQFGQPITLQGIVWIAGLAGRTLLSKMVPFVFKPPMIALVLGEDELPFGEAMNQAKATTRRIWACAAAIAFVVVRRMVRSSECDG